VEVFASPEEGSCYHKKLHQKHRKIMWIFDGIREKVWQIIKKKAIEVLFAMLIAAITALTITSCMGHDSIDF